MCRVFAHISKQPVRSLDLLADSPKSLFAQSNVKGREQRDGWGIGWYARGPRIRKSPGPLPKQERAFRAAAQRARSRVVIGHIRAASNPRGLSRRRLIGPENTQPFAWKQLLFAHNGTVNIPDAVAAALGPLRKRVRGVNDSEAYFWQLVKHYQRLKDVPQALRACVAEQRELWRRGARMKGKSGPFSGLNTWVSDGNALYALCLYPSPSKALLSARPWGNIVYGRRDERWIAASEPVDTGRWESLKTGDILVLKAGAPPQRLRL